MDSNKFCPQCGTFIQNNAKACQNCGTQFNDMEDSTLNPELGNGSHMKPVVRTSKISFWMGILAIFPYPVAIFSSVYYDLFPTAPTASQWVKQALRIVFFYPALLGLITGIPFGLVAISTGVIGYLKQPRIKKNVVTAMAGLLLGMGGISGHIYYIWFVATCQFCN